MFKESSILNTSMQKLEASDLDKSGRFLASHYLTINHPPASSAYRPRPSAASDLYRKLSLTGDQYFLDLLHGIACGNRPESVDANYYMCLWLHLTGANKLVEISKCIDRILARANDISLLAFCFKLKLIQSCSTNSYCLAAEQLQAALASNAVDTETILIYSASRSKHIDRLRIINIALARYGITPISLKSGMCHAERCLLDSVTCSHSKTIRKAKVSVIVAAYGSPAQLETCLESLRNQTWSNLEIIIVDDCSANPGVKTVAESYISEDPRFQYHRLNKNIGAYGARNHGLQYATGKYVTLHDSDDWSHPLKIEVQASILESNTDLIANTSQQARCTHDLTFLSLRRSGTLISMNTSSLMWRRQEVLSECGCWDNVRFGADSELMRRIKHVFGNDAILNIETGPLSFQRMGHGNITSTNYTSLLTLSNGARKEYQESSEFYLQSGGSPNYSRGNKECRPFQVPQIMNKSTGLENSDIVIQGNFFFGSTHLKELHELISAYCAESLKVGIFSVINDDHVDFPAKIDKSIRAAAVPFNLSIYVYGQKVCCDILHIVTPVRPSYRYVPEVLPNRIINSKLSLFSQEI